MPFVILVGLKNKYGVRFAVHIAKKSIFSLKLSAVTIITFLTNE